MKLFISRINLRGLLSVNLPNSKKIHARDSNYWPLRRSTAGWSCCWCWCWPNRRKTGSTSCRGSRGQSVRSEETGLERDRCKYTPSGDDSDKGINFLPVLQKSFQSITEPGGFDLLRLEWPSDQYQVTHPARLENVSASGAGVIRRRICRMNG